MSAWGWNCEDYKMDIILLTGSPFHVDVKNPVNPSKVKCHGPGLDSANVKSGVPAVFTVDASEAGEAPLEVTYTDNTGKPAASFL